MPTAHQEQVIGGSVSCERITSQCSQGEPGFEPETFPLLAPRLFSFVCNASSHTLIYLNSPFIFTIFSPRLTSAPFFLAFRALPTFQFNLRRLIAALFVRHETLSVSPPDPVFSPPHRFPPHLYHPRCPSGTLCSAPSSPSCQGFSSL